MRKARRARRRTTSTSRRIATAPRGRARTLAAKEELRSRILREAMALFVEEGYAGFSMRKLARRLRYSATTLYAYYEHKHDLLLAVIGQGYDLARSYLQVGDGDAMERLHALSNAYFDFAFENPTLYELMFIHRPGRVFESSEDLVRTRFGILQQIIDAALETPPLSHFDETAVRHTIEVFWGALHGLVSLALTVPFFDEKWARRNLAFLLRTLAPLVERYSAELSAAGSAAAAVDRTR
ncbi:MAG: TetR/AcrR family transcriptional regulator [Deltaproteobacteria bacterium]|nr:TetR/AcrR family transcriptional regulator [Deltaproteobacteria bacterium]